MLKKGLPLLILALLVGLAVLASLNPPGNSHSAPPKVRELAVEVMPIRARSYQVVLESYGTVRPRTQSELVAQVGGKIMQISPNFRNGGFFERGEVLVQIDSRDYQAEVNRARASLIEARQALVQEQAQVDQAREDWRRLGNPGKAPQLVLREPQLKAAQAQVLAAEAALDTAQANLERTRIEAPYTGRMLEKKADIGQVVAANTSLASIYAVDYVEVRLPLKNRDLQYIDLPEAFRFEPAPERRLPDVTLISELAQTERWRGKIVRTEGAIDADSQQLYVIAQIDDPYGRGIKDRQPLKIGQYMRAHIQGRELEQALVIPNSTIYQGSYVYVVEADKLLRRTIRRAWHNEEETLVAEGLQAGDQLVTTPLGQVASGTPVRVIATDGEGAPEQAGKTAALGAEVGP